MGCGWCNLLLLGAVCVCEFVCVGSLCQADAAAKRESRYMELAEARVAAAMEAGKVTEDDDVCVAARVDFKL